MSTTAATKASSTEISRSIVALPPLPATAREILASFGDEFIEADKVATVVEGDPGISAKLLGLANSAYFGLAEPVNNIREAIVRVIGVETVRSLVLAMAIQRSFSWNDCRGFDAERFWVQSLLTAECCKRMVSADALASEAVRNMAYSAGLCHNLGLMALAHIQPKRTSTVLQAHLEQPESGNLGRLFFAEFEFNHKMITAELARLWSLPKPMVAAYYYRAFPDSACGDRLGLIVAAGAAAVGNTEVDADQQINLGVWADEFGLAAADLQGMAILGDRQKDKVQSLASNMTG